MRKQLVVAAVILGWAASPVAADRLAPHATQAAVLGCWDVGRGATLRLSARGKHSVIAQARFGVRPDGGPRTMRADGRWIEAEQAYAVPCRPRSQHGSICLVRPAADGLQVRVVAYGAGGRVVGVVEDLVAPRCRAAP
jgi:hypothetical protein